MAGTLRPENIYKCPVLHSNVDSPRLVHHHPDWPRETPRNGMETNNASKATDRPHKITPSTSQPGHRSHRHGRPGVQSTPLVPKHRRRFRAGFKDALPDAPFPPYYTALACMANSKVGTQCSKCPHTRRPESRAVWNAGGPVIEAPGPGRLARSRRA